VSGYLAGFWPITSAFLPFQFAPSLFGLECKKRCREFFERWTSGQISEIAAWTAGRNHHHVPWMASVRLCRSARGCSTTGQRPSASL